MQIFCESAALAFACKTMKDLGGSLSSGGGFRISRSWFLEFRFKGSVGGSFPAIAAIV